MKKLACAAAAFALASLPLAAGPPPDAFLDQPVPRGSLPNPPDQSDHMAAGGNNYMLQFDSYAARMENLRAVLPCPVIFPDGLDPFVREKDIGTDWSKGKTFFLSERNGLGFPPGSTLRDLLNASTASLHLTWNYDPAKNAVLTGFSWHITDPRSGAQLLDYLASHTAGDPFKGPHASIDPWIAAFDALLSRSENYPRVWQLRFTADDRMIFGISVTRNLTVGKITDTHGTSHFLVVNSQEEMMNPGPPGSFSYYLFDPKGRFESGGIHTVGYRCFGDSAWLDPDGRRLWVRTFNNGSQKRDFIFGVENGQLVEKDFLIDGQKPTGFQLYSLDEGKSIFTVGP